MITAVSKLGFVLIFLLCASVSLAQGAPAQINAALLELSARLGYSIGIGNLSNWRWEQTNFPNDALGCPSASSSGGGAVLGYKFQLTHNSVTFDLRVSHDSALVVYCGTVDAASAAAAAEPESEYSNRLCGDAVTGGPYMRSRINAGMTVEILGSYLNMRGQPSISGFGAAADSGRLDYRNHRRSRLRRWLCLVAGACQRSDWLYRRSGRRQLPCGAGTTAAAAKPRGAKRERDSFPARIRAHIGQFPARSRLVFG